MRAWHIAGGVAAAVVVVGVIALASSAKPSATPSGDEPEPVPDDEPEPDEEPEPVPADVDEPEPDDEPAEFKENRVRVADFASLPQSDPRLKILPAELSYGGTRRVHHRVYGSLLALLAAAEAAGLPALRVSSAWRPHRWKSYAEYEAKLIEKYGDRVREKLGEGATDAQIIAEGRKWLAFASPHETGLAVDLRNSDLEAKSATASKQKTTATYAWLKANAAKFGWTPYLREPWHWEQRITSSEFAS